MTTPDRKLCTNTTGELANASNDDLSREMHHFFGRALLASFLRILSLRKLAAFSWVTNITFPTAVVFGKQKMPRIPAKSATN